MDPFNIHSFTELEGKRIPGADIAKLPLMPARTASTVASAIGEDMETFKAVGPFRRPIDKFDHELDPQPIDPQCTDALVMSSGKHLCVLPLQGKG